VEHIEHVLHDQQLRETMHFCILHEQNVERHWPNFDNANATQFDIETGNFRSTMGVIQSCDLIITVDMSVANLAVMMGKETWLIINTESDWKWGVGGSSTPWFTNLRCFRQTEPGAWSPVAAELYAALLEA
jgi:hypothetical protein